MVHSLEMAIRPSPLWLSRSMVLSRIEPIVTAKPHLSRIARHLHHHQNFAILEPTFSRDLLPPGEGGVWVREQQGERFRVRSCHTLG